MARSSAHEPAGAAAAALAPYPWRAFTERMLARRVVGALDQYAVIAFVSGLDGADVGVVDPVEPAVTDDDRVDALVRALAGQRWRGLTLDRLCADLTSSVQEWHAERDSLDSGLRRRLEGR